MKALLESLRLLLNPEVLYEIIQQKLYLTEMANLSTYIHQSCLLYEQVETILQAV
jgi:hypothetical protein